MPHHTSDTRIAGYEPLLAPAALLAELPLGADRETTVEQGRTDIRRVLDLADDRLLVIVGPCSPAGWPSSGASSVTTCSS
jgi:3-deoxy-7-phosphoheptulonate synthase